MQAQGSAGQLHGLGEEYCAFRRTNHGNADAAVIYQLGQTVYQSLAIFVIHNVLDFIDNQQSDMIKCHLADSSN